jgi:hypothetical protein
LIAGESCIESIVAVGTLSNTKTLIHVCVVDEAGVDWGALIHAEFCCVVCHVENTACVVRAIQRNHAHVGEIIRIIASGAVEGTRFAGARYSISPEINTTVGHAKVVSISSELTYRTLLLADSLDCIGLIKSRPGQSIIHTISIGRALRCASNSVVVSP